MGERLGVPPSLSLHRLKFYPSTACCGGFPARDPSLLGARLGGTGERLRVSPSLSLHSLLWRVSRSRSRLTQPLARVSLLCAESKLRGARRRSRASDARLVCTRGRSVARPCHPALSLQASSSIPPQLAVEGPLRSRSRFSPSPLAGRGGEGLSQPPLSLHSLLWRVHSARDPARRAWSLNSPSPDAAERRGGRGARPGLPPSQARERETTSLPARRQCSAGRGRSR